MRERWEAAATLEKGSDVDRVASGRSEGGGGVGVRICAGTRAGRGAEPTVGGTGGGFSTGVGASASGRAGEGERSEPPGKRKRATIASERNSPGSGVRKIPLNALRG